MYFCRSQSYHWEYSTGCTARIDNKRGIKLYLKNIFYWYILLLCLGTDGSMPYKKSNVR